jgi:hypothetical protein
VYVQKLREAHGSRPSPAQSNKRKTLYIKNARMGTHSQEGQGKQKLQNTGHKLTQQSGHCFQRNWGSGTTTIGACSIFYSRWDNSTVSRHIPSFGKEASTTALPPVTLPLCDIRLSHTWVGLEGWDLGLRSMAQRHAYEIAEKSPQLHFEGKMVNWLWPNQTDTTRTSAGRNLRESLKVMIITLTSCLHFPWLISAPDSGHNR